LTKFEHDPYKKVIIKNLVHENLENLISQCNIRRQKDVFWVNGMIIAIPKLNYYEGDKEYENMTNGIQYFEKVIFTKFIKYTPNITREKCVGHVQVLDYSNNNKFKELANWIESQPIWKTIPEKILGEIEIDE
jgi:hypothetical protein